MPLREGEVFFLGTAIAIAPKNPMISGARASFGESDLEAGLITESPLGWLALSARRAGADAGIVTRHRGHPPQVNAGDAPQARPRLARIALHRVRQHRR